MQYSTLFLDLDNTLLDFNKSEYYAAKSTFKNNQMPYDDATINLYSKINKMYWKKFEKGEIKKSDIFENRFITLLNELNLKRDSKKIMNEYFLNLSEHGFIIDGADQVLSYLRKKNYYLCATTNGATATQYKRIKSSGLEPFFHRVFVSEDTGHQKPEKEYFDFVIENIPEKKRSKILIVGDSISSDILGGINSGIDTCWYNPLGEISETPCTFSIKSLSDLLSIL